MGHAPIWQRGHRVFNISNDAKLEEYYTVDTKLSAVLNTSSSGIVKKAVSKRDHLQYAVKQMTKSNFEGVKWSDEIQTVQNLDNPHICRLYELFEDAHNVYLVLEFCRGGNLTTLCKCASINEITISILVRQMVGALTHLHGHDLFHGDLGLESWLFAEPVQKDTKVLNMQLKMIDYGLSYKHLSNSEAKERRKRAVEKWGRLGFFCKSPEQCYDEPLASSAADVWALGVMSYFMISGKSPYAPSAGKTVFDVPLEFKPDSAWKPITYNAKTFIMDSLKSDPELRPKAADLLTSDWMSYAKRSYDKAYEGNKADKTLQQMQGTLSVVDTPLPSAEDIVGAFRRMMDASTLEKAAMTAAAHRLPEAKIGHLRQVFEKLDTNGDGTLSAFELQQGLQSSGIQAAPLMELLQELDTDGSGVIEYTEFVAATYEFQRSMQDAAVKNVFRIFDEDGSGKVTKAEILHVLKPDTDLKTNLETSFPDAQLQELLDTLDKDGDGEIDIEEFKKLLKQESQGKSARTPKQSPRTPRNKRH